VNGCGRWRRHDRWRGIAIEVDHSLPGARIIRVLDALIARRGRPQVIVCDNERPAKSRVQILSVMALARKTRATRQADSAPVGPHVHHSDTRFTRARAARSSSARPSIHGLTSAACTCISSRPASRIKTHLSRAATVDFGMSALTCTGSAALEARAVTESWHVKYDTERPHSSLGDQTPEEYAVAFVAGSLAVPAHPQDQERMLTAAGVAS
jgi:hypothetical protein